MNEKENFKLLRGLIKENPDLARTIIEGDPQLRSLLMTNSAGRNNSKRMTKAIPGIPQMYEYENRNGFSNYLMLAVLAFVIQTVITLICILFYK